MKSNIIAKIIPYVSIVVIACLLLFLEPDFLWKIEEENLFLFNSAFFKELMVAPGGLLTWLGTFFTQFLYYPWLGVALLAAWWALLAWLLGRAFGLNGDCKSPQTGDCKSPQTWWSLLTVIPVLFILVTIVDTGYWVYILKLRGHFFVTTIGATTVAALLWAFRALTSRSPFLISHLSFLICTAAISYPLFGIYGLAATLLMSIWIWRLEPRWGRALAVSAVGLLSVIIVPLICYRHVYYEINLDNVYFAALPLYFIQEEYPTYYIPFYLLLLFFVGISLCFPRMRNEKSERKKGLRGVPAAKHFSFFISLPLLICAVVYTYHYWYRDENFHHELAMQHCIDRLDWEGVVEEAAKQESDPTRAIVMMRNLALAHLGRQGDEMYHYKNGCKRCEAPFDIRAINVAGVPIYYHYGMPNYSYRLCMERGVEFGWRTEQLKYMSRSALVNGELQLARKYLGLLRQTLYHATWADDMWQMTEHPEKIAEMPEMDFINHMMHYDDELTSDNNLVENFLMKRLLYSNYYEDPVFLEQKVLASMAAKNAKLFWVHLFNYSKFYPDRPWPVHVQEAAYMFGDLEKRPDMDRYPISSAVKENFARFDKIAPYYQGQDAEVVKPALYPVFGKTYFYDYYLIVFPPQN